MSPIGRTTSASTPASKASRRPWKSWKPRSGSTCRRASASGVSSATCSMSMPPLVDTGPQGQPPAVEVLEAEERGDVQASERLRRLLGDLLDVHAALGRQHHER